MQPDSEGVSNLEDHQDHGLVTHRPSHCALVLYERSVSSKGFRSERPWKGFHAFVQIIKLNINLLHLNSFENRNSLLKRQASRRLKKQKQNKKLLMGDLIQQTRRFFAVLYLFFFFWMWKNNVFITFQKLWKKTSSALNTEEKAGCASLPSHSARGFLASALSHSAGLYDFTRFPLCASGNWVPIKQFSKLLHVSS